MQNGENVLGIVEKRKGKKRGSNPHDLSAGHKPIGVLQKKKRGAGFDQKDDLRPPGVQGQPSFRREGRGGGSPKDSVVAQGMGFPDIQEKEMSPHTAG